MVDAPGAELFLFACVGQFRVIRERKCRVPVLLKRYHLKADYGVADPGHSPIRPVDLRFNGLHLEVQQQMAESREPQIERGRLLITELFRVEFRVQPKLELENTHSLDVGWLGYGRPARHDEVVFLLRVNARGERRGCLGGSSRRQLLRIRVNSLAEARKGECEDNDRDWRLFPHRSVILPASPSSR